MLRCVFSRIFSREKIAAVYLAYFDDGKWGYGIKKPRRSVFCREYPVPDNEMEMALSVIKQVALQIQGKHPSEVELPDQLTY